MKKLLLFFVGAALAMTAGAAPFELKIGNKVLENGERVDITDNYDEFATQFYTHLELKANQSGTCVATVDFIRNETTPELTTDGIDYISGCRPAVAFCSFDGQCRNVYAGEEITKSGNVSSGSTQDMMIELVCQLGLDEPTTLETIHVNAEFSVEVEMDGVSQKVFFYVDNQQGGVDGIQMDNNDAPATYYDLQGRRVAAPVEGITIMRRGTETIKIIR